jgi:hypothetical protein
VDTRNWDFLPKEESVLVANVDLLSVKLDLTGKKIALAVSGFSNAGDLHQLGICQTCAQAVR